jgi:DNA modification methylase
MLEQTYTQKINDVDWEFADDDTSYLTHDLHRYSSKYIPQIASSLLRIFSKENDLVLDCFVGSGTTLVEALIGKRRAIGVDINPLACLISKVKVTPIDNAILEKETRKLLDGLRLEISSVRRQGNSTFDELGGKGPRLDMPRFPHVKDWFQSQVISELSIIKKHIDSLADRDVKDMTLVAFSSIIRSVSNASSGFGNLMITEKKAEVVNTFERFERRLLEIKRKILELGEYREFGGNVRVALGDARKLDFIEDSSLDLVLTHPPYIAAVPYAEYQKLSLRWLGYDDRALDNELIGGRRQNDDVIERFDDGMAAAFKEMARVLKNKRFCCVVIGNPTVRGRVIPLNKRLVDFGEKAGLEFEHEIRRGKYNTTMGKMKEEFILIFRKVPEIQF